MLYMIADVEVMVQQLNFELTLSYVSYHWCISLGSAGNLGNLYLLYNIPEQQHYISNILVLYG